MTTINSLKQDKCDEAQYLKPTRPPNFLLKLITVVTVAVIAIFFGNSVIHSSFHTPYPMTHYESRMQHPALVTIGKDGSMGYRSGENLRQDHFILLERTRMAKKFSEITKIPKSEAKIESSIGSEFLYRGETGEISSFHFLSIHPEKLTNHKQASLHISNWIQQLDRLELSQICERLVQTQAILMKGADPKFIGLRNVEVFVYDVNYTPSPTSGQFFPTVSVSHEAPSFFDLDQIFMKYAGNLKQKAEELELDPIDFAAYAHQELARIHPFQDGNGRMARLVMNGILRQAGHPPLVFKNSKEYAEAIRHDTENPGYFANWLRKIVIPWVQKELTPNDPCLVELTC